MLGYKINKNEVNITVNIRPARHILFFPDLRLLIYDL